jgi:hypothetical protein
LSSGSKNAMENLGRLRENNLQSYAWSGVGAGKDLGLVDYKRLYDKRRTRRKRFVAEMERVVPWEALIDLIKPFYPKTGPTGGLPPCPLQTNFGIHLMQH